jgi:hypothetical protein
LGSFIAASTDQMLMTRGGYGMSMPISYYSQLRENQGFNFGSGGFFGMENEWNAITSSVSSAYGSFMDSAANAVGTAWDGAVIVVGGVLDFVFNGPIVSGPYLDQLNEEINGASNQTRNN